MALVIPTSEDFEQLYNRMAVLEGKFAELVQELNTRLGNKQEQPAPAPQPVQTQSIPQPAQVPRAMPQPSRGMLPPLR